MALIRISDKFLKILSKHQKIRIVQMFVLMVIAGIMEMLSVSMVLPFVNAVTDPDTAMNSEPVKQICNMLEINDSKLFLVFMAILMAALYIIKNVFLLFQLTVQNKFVNNNMFQVQMKLLGNYLERPYEFFLNIQSGEIMRVIGDDTQRAFSILTMLLAFLSDMIVSGALLIAVFIVSPTVTLTMGMVLLFFTLTIQAVTHPILKRAGDEYIVTQAKKNQWLLQAIQGIKEIKLMRKENFFENQFGKNGKAYAKANYQYQTLAVVPRYMIEAVSMSAFFVIIAVMISTGVEFTQLIPVLSGLAVAAIRLLPAVNRMSNSLAGIAFGEGAIDKLIDNLRIMEGGAKDKNHSDKSKGNVNEKIGKMNTQIKMDNVDYIYPQGSKKILNDANLIIKKGETIGIVGTSGSGKTTAVDVLLGLLEPKAGTIIVDDIDIRKDMAGWLSNIGYIPQSIFMLDGSIRENVAFGVDKENIDDEIVWRVLHEASIDKFVRELPMGLDTQIGERGMRISGGQRQRLGIARALYGNPSVLVFDEATSALDNETEAAIMESISRLYGTKTMVIIAHRLSTIEGCDKIYRVSNGKIERERYR